MAEIFNDDHTLMPAAPAGGDGLSGKALAVGTVIGEFRIESVIGEGGFGIVYLAYDESLGRRVALKEYMPSALADREGTTSVKVISRRHADTFAAGLRSFVNEAHLLAQFDHPSLVKVHRFFQANATAYMVMPFYRGITLKATLRGLDSPPDEAWLKQLLRPLFDALEVIHGRDCYHRDISPDNILLLHDNTPVLLDFGAARRVIGDMTQALTVILKPGYAPIEQYAEDPDMKQGPWTDVYALASVVYFALTGEPPISAMSRVMTDRLVPLSQRVRDRYSAHFLKAIDAALALKPQDRPQSIAQFRLSLEEPPVARLSAAVPQNALSSMPASAAPTSLATANEAPPDSGHRTDAVYSTPVRRRAVPTLAITLSAGAFAAVALTLWTAPWKPSDPIETLQARADGELQKKAAEAPSPEKAVPAQVETATRDVQPVIAPLTTVPAPGGVAHANYRNQRAEPVGQESITASTAPPPQTNAVRAETSQVPQAQKASEREPAIDKVEAKAKQDRVEPAQDSIRAAAPAPAKPALRALVIGNSAYMPERQSIPSARKNVSDLAGALTTRGFTVTRAVDQSVPATRELIRGFLAAARADSSPRSIAIIYYTGQGIQMNGENYMVLSDVRLDQPVSAIAKASINIDREIIAQSSLPNDGTAVLIFDACRNDPSLSPEANSANAALQKLTAPPPGTIVTFSTAVGKYAIAPKSGDESSIYTGILVDELRKANASIAMKDFLDGANRRVTAFMEQHEEAFLRRYAQHPELVANLKMRVRLDGEIVASQGRR